MATTAAHSGGKQAMDLRQRGEDLTQKMNRRVARQKALVDKQAAVLMDRAAEFADKVESIPTAVAKRVTPRPRPRRRLLLLTLVLGAIGGFAASYFGDRERG